MGNLKSKISNIHTNYILKHRTVIPLPPRVQRVVEHPNEQWYNPAIDPLAHEHPLRLTRGIYVMEDWWRQQNVTVSYKLTDFNQYHLHPIQNLDQYVRQLHKLVAPQQRLDDKFLIFGMGATQLLHAAIYALCVQHANKIKNSVMLQAKMLYFTHRTPGYLDTKEVINSFGGINTAWVDFGAHQKIPANDLVELVTSPNNPDGVILQPQTQAKFHIHDRVNHWPFFISDDLMNFYDETLENEQISIFSLAKVLSFSGSRVGYAFVNDFEIAHHMQYFITMQTHGIAADGQMRCMVALRHLLENNLVPTYVDWLSDILLKRWHRAERAFAKTDIELLNHCGANLWIKTPGHAEHYLMQHYRIEATYGPEYGAPENYARLNMQCTKGEFEELIWRLEHPLSAAAH